MSNIWYTSDLHFDHEAIIKYCNRPFVSKNEMNTTLISNFNSLVKPNDTVYCLGDFSFKNPLQWLKVLNGNWHLIRGNHDAKQSHGFKSVQDVLLQKNVISNFHIFMSHYAHRVWPHSHHGIGHLFGHSHGHSHGTLESYSRSFDCGVDTNNFLPYHLDEVIQKFKTLNPIVIFGKDPLGE